jgi:flagellar hook-associated protein 3 FlgL
MMRVSTFNIFQSQLNNITGKTATVHQQMNKLSSGVRVETAGEDPVAMNSILNYKQELQKIAQYSKNIDLAENRLRREESALTVGENLLQQSKEILLKANNGTFTQQERDAYATELRHRIGEMVDLANSRDEFGQYIFGGFQTDNPPFTLQPDGSVRYHGDGGQRQMAVGDSVKVAINHDGRLVFGQAANPRGDFTAAYALTDQSREHNLRVESARIGDAAAFGDRHPYQVSFADNAGTLEITITDDDGNSLTEPFEAGKAYRLDGVDLVLSGEARAGDGITLSSNQSDGTGQDHIDVFDTLNRALAWLQQDNNNPSGQSELTEVLDGLDAISGHFTRVRADTGNRLLRLDNQRNNHEDMTLTLEKVRSGMEDLDYAQAIGELNQTMVALQATQTMFGKVQGMSLFNYI